MRRGKLSRDAIPGFYEQAFNRDSRMKHDWRARRVQTVTGVTCCRPGLPCNVSNYKKISRCGYFRLFHIRLMREAMQAAPNPLSMFTTETLGAQVFNIPRRAATPPKEAP